MTPDQESLLRDKIQVWSAQSHTGVMDMRDYHARAADALTALFARAEAAESRLTSLSAAVSRLVEAVNTACDDLDALDSETKDRAAGKFAIKIGRTLSDALSSLESALDTGRGGEL